MLAAAARRFQQRKQAPMKQLPSPLGMSGAPTSFPSQLLRR